MTVVSWRLRRVFEEDLDKVLNLDYSLSISIHDSSSLNLSESYWFKLITWRDSVLLLRDTINPS